MAEKKRGSYTPDFRIKAADLAIASEVRIGDIAKTLNVLPNTLSNWEKATTQVVNAVCWQHSG